MSGLTKAQEAELLEMMRTMMEENRKTTEELCQKMNDNFKETNKKLDDLNKTIKEWREEIRNDNKPKTEEVPKDKNMEHGNQKTEENGIKNQIIKKTEERRMIRPKKVRITREILEMTRSGLINFINHPIINHRKAINGKKYEKNFMKIFEVDHHATVRKNFTKRVVRLNTPRKGIFLNRSMTSSIIKIPGTRLGSKPNAEAIDSKSNTIRKATKEKLQHQSTGKELTETESVQNTNTGLKLKETLVKMKWNDKMIVRYVSSTESHLNTKMIQTTNAPKMIDHG